MSMLLEAANSVQADSAQILIIKTIKNMGSEISKPD